MHSALPCSGLHRRGVHFHVEIQQWNRGGGSLAEPLYGLHVGNRRQAGSDKDAIPVEVLRVRGSSIWSGRNTAIVDFEVRSSLHVRDRRMVLFVWPKLMFTSSVLDATTTTISLTHGTLCLCILLLQHRVLHTVCHQPLLYLHTTRDFDQFIGADL